ncbi:LysE family translocator [Sphingopyxis sp. L1A2A]|uniref:LysE family translocator n=1 Tax=Sphingopyxis sp. L1A2A TaxID=2502247 RepID=UPI0020160D58|nr:LysE family translocator [Sphingopyxis sp. L1A2A]
MSAIICNPRTAETRYVARMNQTTLLALSAFALVSSITPGPNNMMLMASGANFGLRRTVPHALGVGIGFTLMIILVGLGLMGLFDLFPILNSVLKVVSVAYLLWLAWKIANAAAPDTETGARGKPMTFVQAMLFQWVNPKAWSMALTAIALYAPDRNLGAVLLVAVVFGLINLPSTSLWAVMGQILRGWLSSPARLRAFNWTMAALLVGSLALLI